MTLHESPSIPGPSTHVVPQSLTNMQLATLLWDTTTFGQHIANCFSFII